MFQNINKIKYIVKVTEAGGLIFLNNLCIKVDKNQYDRKNNITIT